MDQGDAAVWAAGIGVIGTAIGALGGYLAGRAQGRATVDGVKLQLLGQREDAVWQAEIDAYAAMIDSFNAARMQIANTFALFEAPRRDLSHMARFGFGTREEAFAGVIECAKACVSRENALRLRTAPSYADMATEVRKELNKVVEALQAWCIAVDRRRPAEQLKAQFNARMDSYRDALDCLVEDSQARFSRPRP